MFARLIEDRVLYTFKVWANWGLAEGVGRWHPLRLRCALLFDLAWPKVSIRLLSWAWHEQAVRPRRTKEMRWLCV